MFFFTSHLLWTTLHISILSLSFQMFVGQVGSNENKMGFMFNDIISTFLVQVNYCHHLVSVVCKLFTFQASSPKPLGQLEPNLAGMFLGWSSTKFLFFFPVGYSTWLPGPIICSDRLKFQRSSSLKLMNWLNPNCKWMIIGMSFTKFLFFMPIGNPRWPPPQDID
jgi:hypothetical protein